MDSAERQPSRAEPDKAAIEIDISQLQPEARSIARTAAEVYLRHTQPHVVGLIAHGSAVKGGVIPGCSDLDLQLYLDPAAFDAESQLPFEQSLAIARDLATINPAPFGYIQCYAWPCALPAGHVGPIPGAYSILAGQLAVHEATEDELRAGARRRLDTLEPLPPTLASGLLERGNERLATRVRWLCTDVWPTLYSVLALQHDDAIAIWNLPKLEAMALLPEESVLGRAMRQFYAAVLAYYSVETSPERGLDVIASGVACVRAARAWWEEWRKEGTDR